MIEIFGKTQCPYCDKAKALAENKGYEYVYKQLDTDFTREELFEQFPTARTFPQIRIDGEAIGGYDNFLDWSSVE
jgi:glutaredoxin 3